MKLVAFAVVSALAVVGCGVGEMEINGEDQLASVEGEARSTTYNCRRDKQLDVAGSFTYEVLSSARLRLKMTAGTDAAGMGSYSYTITDSAGAATSLSATRMTCFGEETLTDGFVDGLNAKARYTVTLTSSDKCGNSVTTAPISFETPTTAPETNGPRIASFGLSSVNWFGSSVPVLRAQVEDDTGMDRVEFWADGVLVGTDTLKSTGGLWSTTLGFYTAPGANYFVYPTRGQTKLFEVRAFDVLGNSSVVSATIAVP